MHRRQRGAERRRSPPQGRAPHLNARLFQALRIGWVPAGPTSAAPKSPGPPSPPTRPPGPRRRKVRLTPVPPDGKTCVRSLAPPLPPAPACAGLPAGGPRLRRPFSGDVKSASSTPNRVGAGGTYFSRSEITWATFTPTTRPPGPRRKVRLTPVPPDGKTCVRSLLLRSHRHPLALGCRRAGAACGGRSLEMSNLLRALRIGWVPAGLTSAAPKSLGRPSRPTRPPGLGRGSRPRRRPRRRSRAGRSPARWTGPAGRSRT